MSVALNVLGTPLRPCSYDPLTGWFRDGCCHVDERDAGSHVICAVSGAEVPLETLRYWSTERQEAYASAELATRRLLAQG